MIELQVSSGPNYFRDWKTDQFYKEKHTTLRDIVLKKQTFIGYQKKVT